MTAGADDTTNSDVGRPPTVGLVLGAGGIPGFGYLAGSLAALEAATGWDPRSAALIVGTSAGAATGVLLRAGLSAPDLLASNRAQPLSSAGQQLLDRAPAARWDDAEHGPGPASKFPAAPALAARSLLRWPPRPGLTLAGALPKGRHLTATIGARYRALLPAWPTDPLWLCAVRSSDGRRVAFGRDDLPEVDVGTAVEASSSVPGHFRPVAIGGGTYCDGGAWSVTNADLAATLAFDALVVIAPLSATKDALRWTADGAQRAYHRAVLDRELHGARRLETHLIVVEPTSKDLAMFPARWNAGDRDKIAEQAFLSMQARLAARPQLGAPLTTRVTT